MHALANALHLGDDGGRELDSALARDTRLRRLLHGIQHVLGNDDTRQIRIEPGTALLGLERDDSGEDGHVVRLHRIDETLQRITVEHGLGLEQPGARVDLATGVLDLGFEPFRAGITRGAEEQVGRAG